MLGLGLSIPQVAARGSRSLVAAIRSLFAASEPGVWFDPSDLSTLFQDAAGTTPVTAVEQPVGLMLDKSKGLVLGPELVTNGDFSDGLAGWSQTGTTWSPAGGTAKNDGTAGYLYKESIVTVGARVVVECTVADKGTAGSLSISLNNGGPTASFSSASLVNGQRVSVRGVKTLNGNVYFFGQGGWNGAIDNISVREILGNHASQTTATSRPVLSARYNLLTKTERFDDAAWGKNGVVVTANNTTAPDGTLTADLITEDTSAGSHRPQQLITVTSGTTYTFSCFIKAAGKRYCALSAVTTFAGDAYAWIDLQTKTAVAGSGALSARIEDVGGGWLRCSLTATATSSGTAAFPIYLTDAAYSITYTGDGTSGIYIWGADLRVANDGANLPPYQRVNTATDYDTQGFPHYLRFDGVDDWLVTPTITPGTDKAQVFAGVRKLSDAAAGIVCELSQDSNVNPGSLYLLAPTSAAPSYGFRSRGTVVPTTLTGTLASPVSLVLTGVAQIASPLQVLRANGVQINRSTTDQGTGNYLAYPLYIGRRGGTTLPFNGLLYSLIVRFGNNLPAATIEKTEKYINTKTRAY